MSREPKAALIGRILTVLRETDELVDRIEEAAAATLDVHRTDFHCLAVLSRSGPLTAGEVAAATGLTSGAATALLDRLEARGYVRRVRDRHDRRQVVVEVTSTARNKAEPLFAGLIAAAQSAFSDFSRDDLETVLRFLQRNHGVVADHLRKLD